MRYNVLTEKNSKIALHSNVDKRMQLIHSLETYVYETIKDLVSEKEEIKCNYNKTMQKKKVNFDDVIKENIKNIMQISLKFLIIYTEYY